MLIEIVSHCWAAELPHYADALRYQLSSVVLHAPVSCQVLVTVCYCPEDTATLDTIGWFAGQRRDLINPLALTKQQLGRRAIGRNLAALATKADRVWFADVDQVFYKGCLDRLAALDWPTEASMIFPRRIKIHCDHATGDQTLAKAQSTSRMVDIDPSQFIDKRYIRAIGGVQIVQGDFAREHGYLKDSKKWQRLRKDNLMFRDFHDDLAYRRFCSGLGTIRAVDLDGMYRLRHVLKTHSG
jgi:hypothetical protein